MKTQIKKVQISGGTVADLDLTLTGKILTPSNDVIHIIVDQKSVEALEEAIGLRKPDATPILAPANIPAGTVHSVSMDILNIPSDNEMKEVCTEYQLELKTNREEYTRMLAEVIWQGRCMTGAPGNDKSDWYSAQALIDVRIHQKI